LHLYTSGFQNTPDLENAKESFDIFDATLKINELSLEDVEAEIPKILFYIEQPEIMQLNIAIPVHFSTLLAKRDDVNLLFSGQGIDELFCGYSRHVNTAKSKGYDKLYEQLWHEFETFPQITLERDDALSKAHRTTYSLPFLDQRIVNYTVRIPPAFKVYNTGTNFVRKWILRQVAEKLQLPKKIYKRKKVAMQFGSGTATALSHIAKLNGFDKSLAKKSGYQNNQKMFLEAIASILGFPFREKKRKNLLTVVPDEWKEKIIHNLSFIDPSQNFSKRF
jgi:asparagine synthase (glutamine-hydrolysing)